MLRTIGLHLGKRVKFISCPYVIAYPGTWFLYLLSGKKKDFREKVQRLCEPRAYPHEAASADFGFTPRAFSDGVGPEVEDVEVLAGKGFPDLPVEAEDLLIRGHAEQQHVFDGVLEKGALEDGFVPVPAAVAAQDDVPEFLLT